MQRRDCPHCGATVFCLKTADCQEFTHCSICKQPFDRDKHLKKCIETQRLQIAHLEQQLQNYRHKNGKAMQQQTESKK